jgi:hypothetical protein
MFLIPAVFHVAASLIFPPFSPSTQFAAADVVAESDDGIERGAALARDRMHINLPNSSLLSTDNSASPMLRPFINS